MGQIITVSGVSGSGKTTLVDHMLSLGFPYRIIESATTRDPRERDRPGEFLYLSHMDFLRMGAECEFLWITPPIHGTQYGTLRDSVKKALITRGSISIMVITIECLPLLREYAGHYAQNVTGLYIESPGEKVLRARLIGRGDQPEDIERRIQECHDWDSKAREIKEHPPIHFIRNNEGLEEFFAEAKRHYAP